MQIGEAPRYSSIIVVLLAALAGARVVEAATVYVSPLGNDSNNGQSWATAKLTVQAGLDIAVSGDQVWVAGGTYIQRITLKDGVALYGGFAGSEDPVTFSLASRDYVANQTILDGNRAGKVVTSPSTGIAPICIDGFTIRNGLTTSYGGGIYCQSSSLTIANNTIVGNSAHYDGGGIYCYCSSPTIANNTITGNTSSQSGGGIHCFCSSPTITSNTIIGNNACSGGGGIHCYCSSPTIVNNTIKGNGATSGGGICCDSSSSPTIANNTVTGNNAGNGGGVCCSSSSSSSPIIYNTIIAFNSSGIDNTGSAPPILQYNCIYENTAYNYSGISDPTGTDGNMSVDPKLADLAYGNVHIQPDSPCVNAGNNAYISGDRDIDGQPRIQPASGTVDIGADESDGTVSSPGPYIIVRVAPGGNDANDGSTWALAKRTVQAAIDEASASGGEVWVQAGTYAERITLKPYSYVYGGFAGTEMVRTERDWGRNTTVLDGQQAGSVVTVAAGHQVSRIDGFTIRNGLASPCGGGIDCSYASPTIANNRIVGNAASYGGGIHCLYSFPTIADNTITANSASDYGGGIYCSFSSPIIANNTITKNNAGEGGGIRCSSSSPIIANTIIAFNSSGIDNTGSAPPILQYNCIYGNTAYNYSGISDPTGTDGNMSVDPKLADLAYGNVHIQPDSPCADAGDNSYALGNDMDGQLRIQPTDGTVDIGADESDGTAYLPGPYIIVRVAPDGDDASDGSTWPLAKRTVQAAIDEASIFGGEVWVQAGVYAERITLRPYAYLYGGFAGAEMVQAQRDWSRNTTVLDGQQGGSVVTVGAGAQASCIDGFTIRNGLGSPSSGGGIYCHHSSPTIANNTITGNNAPCGGGILCFYSSPAIPNNTITGNNASDYGGGIFCSYSSPTITSNKITGNIASDYGGGIFCSYSSPPITSNVITGNKASKGGGIHYNSSSSPTIANNTIAGNAAYEDGGGIYQSSPSSVVINNTITGNNASHGGGGIFCYYSSTSTITNNTIAGNSASSGGGISCSNSSSPTIANNTIRQNSVSEYGGGIFCSFSSPTIANNTITGNTAFNGGGGISCYGSSSPTIANTIIGFNSSGIYKTDSATLVLRHNCVYGNTAYNYSAISDPTGTDGNMSVDPKLADLAYGNMHIQPDSPCADAGDNSYAFGNDMDGQLRIQPAGGTVDIGADESDGTVSSPGPYIIVRVAPGGNDANDGSTWALAKRTVQAAIDEASAFGGEVWVQAGTYAERITLKPYAYLYGGFAGTELAQVERDWNRNTTVLDGQQAGSVVTVGAGSQAAALTVSPFVMALLPFPAAGFIVPVRLRQ